MEKKTTFIHFIIAIAALVLNACDSNSSSEPNIDSIDWTASNVIDWDEAPQSCTASFDKDTVFIDFRFKKWTWSEVDVFNGQSVRTIQTFTGLENSDLNNFCNDEKRKINAPQTSKVNTINVICNDNIIISEAIIDENYDAAYQLATIARRMSKLCTLLLNGDISIKDVLFFSENE